MDLSSNVTVAFSRTPPKCNRCNRRRFLNEKFILGSVKAYHSARRYTQVWNVRERERNGESSTLIGGAHFRHAILSAIQTHFVNRIQVYGDLRCFAKDFALKPGEIGCRHLFARKRRRKEITRRSRSHDFSPEENRGGGGRFGLVRWLLEMPRTLRDWKGKYVKSQGDIPRPPAGKKEIIFQPREPALS